MMTIWLAVLMTCSNSYLRPDIKCDMEGSEDMWKDKATCEIEAHKLYKRPFRCIDVDVEMKGLPKNVEVRIK